MASELRLGVNVDHVATIRNARGGGLPDPVRAAQAAAAADADSIVAHLREDRRHISDDDLIRLLEAIEIPLTLEMAATDEMLDIALRHGPHAVCIVPERREERTTEGGLTWPQVTIISNASWTVWEKAVRLFRCLSNRIVSS